MLPHLPGTPIGFAEIPANARSRAAGLAIQKALASLDADVDATAPSSRPISVRHIEPSLQPKSAVPTADQSAALGKLRWQSGKQLEVKLDQNGSIAYLEGMRLQPGADEADPGKSLSQTTASRFLQDKAKLLQIADPTTETSLVSETQDDLGYTQVRFCQRFSGLEVYPADLMVQLNPKGDVSLMMGSYIPTPAEVLTQPAVVAETALSAARTHVNAAANTAVHEQALVVYAPKKAQPRLAYKIELETSMLQDWVVLVDAQNGSILNASNRVCSAVATGSGVDDGGNTRPLKLWKHTDNKFYMTNTSKFMFDAANSSPPFLNNTKGGIVILDAQNGQSDDPNLKVKYSLSGSSTSGWRKDAVSAAFNLDRVYDFYKLRFNRNSINAKGGTLTGIVNFNFFNAYWNPSAEAMFFGNQDRFAYAFDVVAHEMSHGVTTNTSNLEYNGESGALNESFSDIMGEGCEGYYNANKLPDYLSGTLLLSDLKRDFINPGNRKFAGTRGYPSRMSQFVTVNDPDPIVATNVQNDSGGVHVNSSIINHTFWVLASGLNPGVGHKDALSIFYRGFTTKLQRNSQFLDCRRGCVAAAKELFGNGSTQAAKTAAAFDAVEIFDGGNTNPDPPPTGGTTGVDSTLFTFYYNGSLYLGRKEAAQGDGQFGNFLGTNFAASYKRLSVAGDGTQAVFVTSLYDLGFVNTATGAATTLGIPGQVFSAAISANGRKIGLVFRDVTGEALNTIFVYDAITGEEKNYALVAPVIDGGGTDTVLYADALDFSVDGRYLYYDAVNRLKFTNGQTVDTWSIFGIDSKNGQTYSLLNPQADVDVGNPAIGQSHTNLLTFEIESSQGVGAVLTYDLATGEVVNDVTTAGGFDVPGVSYPGYTGGDTALIYTNYSFDGFGFPVSYLERLPLDSDGINPAGKATTWLATTGLESGVIYRRGAFQKLPVLSASAPDAVAQKNTTNTAKFRVSRTGSTSKVMPFSFVLPGSAVNGDDYAAVSLNAKILAGKTYVDIVITPLKKNLSSERQMTLTLTDASYLTVGTRTAKVTIKAAP